MNNDALFMKNKPLSKGALALAERLKAQGAEMLFAIVGDLSLSGRYAGSALIFTKDTLYVYDEESGEKSYSYPTLSDVRAKRMYGNATLSAMIGSNVLFSG